jgi:hypothetical protein
LQHNLDNKLLEQALWEALAKQLLRLLQLEPLLLPLRPKLSLLLAQQHQLRRRSRLGSRVTRMR